MTAKIQAPREFTGKHMLLLAIGFFGVIISVNVLMAVLSATSWTGLVVQNSYVASQEFETRRIAHDAQQAAGWQSDIRLAEGRVMLSVRDAAGQPVALGLVELLVNRPVGGHDDQRLVLERQTDGSYAADLHLAGGVWDLHVEAPETALGPYDLHERLSLSGN